MTQVPASFDIVFCTQTCRLSCRILHINLSVVLWQAQAGPLTMTKPMQSHSSYHTEIIVGKCLGKTRWKSQPFSTLRPLWPLHSHSHFCQLHQRPRVPCLQIKERTMTTTEIVYSQYMWTDKCYFMWIPIAHIFQKFRLKIQRRIFSTTYWIFAGISVFQFVFQFQGKFSSALVSPVPNWATVYRHAINPTPTIYYNSF